MHTVTCPTCNASIKNGPQHAGKRIECPSCSHELMMPPPPPEPPQQRPVVVEPVPVDMRFGCPYCQTQLGIPPSQAGQAVSCPTCNGRFQVPIPVASHFSSGVQFRSGGATGEVGSKRLAAGLIGIFFGGLGIHKFILGLNTPAIIMLSVWLTGFVGGMCVFVPLIASMAMAIVGMIEGILYLTMSDADFYNRYIVEKREWF